MKKIFTQALSLGLSLCMLGGSVSATPILETPMQSIERNTNVASSVTLAEKGVKPGLNVLNQTESAWGFETAAEESYSSVMTFSMPSGSTHSVASNPKKDDVNASDKALRMETVLTSGSEAYPHVDFPLADKIEGDRPVYISFKYKKTYEPKADETHSGESLLWVMKDGGYVAHSVHGFDMNADWKSFSGMVDFSKAYNASDSSKKDTSDFSKLYLQAKTLKADGKTVLWYDDFYFVPSYKCTYYRNDGTDSVVSSSYFLLDADGNVLKSYTADLTVIPKARYGYIFKGWATASDATDVLTDGVITLANEDIALYAVWEKDESASEATEYVWNFEDSTSQTWTGNTLSYKNGMAVLNTTPGSYSGNTYISHPKVSLDTKAHRYLIFKARSLGNISAVRFYYATTDETNMSEDKAFNVPLVTNSSVFREYYYDLSTLEKWTGNYTSCMFNPCGTGVLEIEEIRFATLYEPENDVINEYHYTLSGLNAWGTVSKTAGENGTYTLVRTDTTGQGGINLNAPDSLDASVYNKFFVKLKAEGTFDGFKFYYTSSASTGMNETKTFSAMTKLSTDENGYTLYMADLSKRSDYGGTVGGFMISYGGSFSVTVSDVFLADTIPTNKSEVIEKAALYTDRTAISTDRGTATVTPYVRYTDGREETDFSKLYYITDSVAAQVVKNENGTATVTAQMNGSVGITAVFPDGLTSKTVSFTLTGQAERLAANSFKVMMFGNSIRGHGKAESIGWYGDGWGMAASSEDKDYAHRFIYYMNQKYGENVASLVPGSTPAGFEGAAATCTDYKAEDFKGYADDFASCVTQYKPDIVTIQLGENGGEAKSADAYAKVMTQVIRAIQEAAPNAVVVISTPFWSADTTNKVVGTYAAAETCDIMVAPVNTLGATAWNSDNKNMAFDAPWITDQTSGGVKAHPGDVGMDNIAKMFFEKVNITLSANERTVYSTVPQSVTISCDGTPSITREKGTLQLSASVLPADAAQDVNWSVDNKYIGTVDENGCVTAVNNGTLTVTATSKYVSTVSTSVEIQISGQSEPHTVTYDKNTTDTVTNMPSPNTLAKDGFVFDATYPERSTYSFIGWAPKSDATAKDVLTTLDVTENITVYAVWEKASRWTFDRDGYKERFTVENGFNEYVLNGYFTTIATGTDIENGTVLKVVSPLLDLKASDWYSLVLRMKSSEPAADSEVKMTVKATGGNVTFKKAIPSDEYYDYEFVLNEVSGTITGFEFKPTNVDTTIYIDTVSFEKSPILRYDAATTDTVVGLPAGYYGSYGSVSVSTLVPTRTGYTFLGWSKKAAGKLLVGETIDVSEPTVLYAVWDKNDHWEFDKASLYSLANVDASKTRYTDGVLHYESTNSNDPIVGTKKEFGYLTTSTSGILKIKMKWNTANTSDMKTQIFFTTPESPNASEDKSAVVSLSNFGSSPSDWCEVTVDLSGKAAWKGTLKSLRFDLTSFIGTCDADYIRFSDSEANLLTDKGEKRKVSDDWGTYLVKEGGTLVPEGTVFLKNVYLAGDIDMTDGVVAVTDTVEIADDASYAVFTADTSDAVIASADYMRLSGFDGTVKIKDGAKYLVKLDNGVGFVWFGSIGNPTGRAYYKVTKDGVQTLSSDWVATDKAVSLRTVSPAGIRFRASFAAEFLSASRDTDGYAVKEYGFLVSNDLKLKDVSELSFATVEKGYAVKGVAHDGVSEDVIYGYNDDGDTVITAVLLGIPDSRTAYQTKLFLRPYAVLDNGNAIYGTPMTGSLYDFAKVFPSDSDEAASEFIKHIIETVEQ